MTDPIDIVDELRGFAAGSESARASLMRDAADEIEKLRDRVYSMQMANDMLRATHKTDNQYLLDEIERLRGEGGWEYALFDDWNTEPYSTASTDLNWLLDGPMHSGTVVRRRRKAGPWERVEGEGDE